MIRKRVREIRIETVRKKGEEGVDKAIARGQGKTLGATACATCLSQQVCTQVIGKNSRCPRLFLPSPRALPGTILPPVQECVTSWTAAGLVAVKGAAIAGAYGCADSLSSAA